MVNEDAGKAFEVRRIGWPEFRRAVCQISYAAGIVEPVETQRRGIGDIGAYECGFNSTAVIVYSSGLPLMIIRDAAIQR